MNFAALRYRIRDPRGVFARIAVFVPLYAIIIALPFYLGHTAGTWPLATACAIILASLGPLAYRSLHSSAANHAKFRKTHDKIMSAEKLASIAGLAEGVAHQINNRLNHFSMASSELKYEIDSYMGKNSAAIAANAELKETFEYLARISDSLIDNVKRTDGIIKGILNYARIETREAVFSHFPLQEIIDLSRDLLKVKHAIEAFPIEHAGSPSDDLYGIKSQIMECVYTVIDNAYEATLEKSRSMNEDELKNYRPHVRVTISRTGTAATIEITDNGIGIKDAARQKIFAPFFSTKSSYKSGTGIGLYVAKRMIEENNRGRIWFESRCGEGSSFFIELPYQPDAAKFTSR